MSPLSLSGVDERDDKVAKKCQQEKSKGLSTGLKVDKNKSGIESKISDGNGFMDKLFEKVKMKVSVKRTSLSDMNEMDDFCVELLECDPKDVNGKNDHDYFYYYVYIEFKDSTGLNYIMFAHDI